MKYVLALIAALPMPVYAKTLYIARSGDITVSLTDEPCQIQAVSNLPKRAIWVEKGKTFEGCYGLQPNAGIVMAYFDDKTVAVFPGQLFERAVEI